MAIIFVEERLDIGINYGAQFGLKALTDVIPQSDGLEQTRACWEQPLITVTLGTKLLNQFELNYLVDFHARMQGNYKGFRIKDWSDYKVKNCPVAPQTPTNSLNSSVGNGTTQQWQLIKRYQNFDTPLVTDAGDYWVDRLITKPVAGTLIVYVAGVQTLTGWSIDTTTGGLTTNLTGTITVDFEFDTPVCFDNKKIDFKFIAHEKETGLSFYELQNVTISEMRVTPAIYPRIEGLGAYTLNRPPQQVIPLIVNFFIDEDTWIDLGTMGGPATETGIVSSASGWEDRFSYWEYNTFKTWDLGNRDLMASTLQRFITFFRLMRGRAIRFIYRDYQDNYHYVCRFLEDQIRFQFDAYRAEDQEVIFRFAGIGIKQAEPLELLVRGGNYDRTWRVDYQVDKYELDGTAVSSTEYSTTVDSAIAFISFRELDGYFRRGINRLDFVSNTESYLIEIKSFGFNNEVNKVIAASFNTGWPYRVLFYVLRIEPA
jgi:uncharacterized protein (TIGR02217 family)